MLNEEVAKYRKLSGDNNPDTPISRIGGYLDGYERALAERKSVWHKTIFEGFPSESDQVLVTDGRYFWVDESVANDVGLEWSCFDGCWEDTEWAYFKDLRGESK